MNDRKKTLIKPKKIIYVEEEMLVNAGNDIQKILLPKCPYCGKLPTYNINPCPYCGKMIDYSKKECE